MEKSHKPGRDASQLVLHCAKQLWCCHNSVGAWAFYSPRFKGEKGANAFSKENNACAILKPNLDGLRSLGLYAQPFMIF